MKIILAFCFTLIFVSYIHAQVAHVSGEKIRTLVQNWNDANNSKDIEKLKSLFDQTVLFRGEKLSQSQFLKRKINVFNSHNSFGQKILGALDLKAYSKGSIKCEFKIEVKSESQIRSYPYYLLLKNTKDGYMISGEGEQNSSIAEFDLGERIGVVDTSRNKTLINTLPSKRKIIDSKIIAVATMFLFALGFVWFWRKKQVRKSQTEFEKEDNNWQIQTTTPDYESKNQSWQVSKTERPLVVNQHIHHHFHNVEVINKRNLVEENDNSTKGYEFEKYVVNKFNKRYFKLKDWRGDKKSGASYPQSNTYPDLVFFFKLNNKEFAVECKFRKKLFKEIFDISPEQIIRYKEFQKRKRIDVYLALGLDGAPANPKEVFLIPLDDVHDLPFSYEFLVKYKKDTTKTFFFDKYIHRPK